MDIKKRKSLLVILAVIFIFAIAVAVRYAPVYQKGYANSVSAENLILARNLSLTGEYKVVNEKNVVLSSSLIEEEGVPFTGNDNKLTPLLYSKIFNLFGFDYNIPLYLAILLYALTNVILFLLVLKLFNFKVALIFSLIDIFAPILLIGAGTLGYYEFALFFFSLALLFYLYQEKTNWLNLILASLLFALAALCRNAFLLSFLPFVIYDWWKNRSWQRIIIFILPFILLFGSFWAYDSVSQGGVNDRLVKGDIGYDGHLFFDPYTYHFAKDEYLDSIKGTSHSLLNEYLINYGQSVSLKNKLIMYFDSIKQYPLDLIRIITFGGPLMILLALMGIIYLWQKKRYLMVLFGFWFFVWYLLLVYLKTNNFIHLLEIRLPIILLMALGAYWFIEWILKLDQKKYRKFLIIVFILAIFLHLGLANKWALHDTYNNTQTETFLTLSQAIKESNVDSSEVIAVGSIAGGADLPLNYYTDLNFIYFSNETVEKLLEENKLQWAFDQYGVTRIVGYEKELTNKIVEASQAENIASLD